jgi:transposase
VDTSVSTQQRRSRKQYSPELKLKLVKMAMKAIDEGSSVAALARQYDVNDNLLFNGCASGSAKVRYPGLDASTLKTHLPHFYLFNSRRQCRTYPLL